MGWFFEGLLVLAKYSGGGSETWLQSVRNFASLHECRGLHNPSADQRRHSFFARARQRRLSLFSYSALMPSTAARQTSQEVQGSHDAQPVLPPSFLPHPRGALCAAPAGHPLLCCPQKEAEVTLLLLQQTSCVSACTQAHACCVFSLLC